MADFRRVVTAFAVVALLMGLAISANAQATCTVTAASSTPMRGEGLTELTGDVVLSCTGIAASGTANITLFVAGTTVTNKIVNADTSATDALLLVDEPGVAGNPPVLGANAIQGTLATNNSLTFQVPITPPASGSGIHIYRLTNIRINASPFLSSSGVPQAVSGFVSISGTGTLPTLNTPNVTIGQVQQGLTVSLRNAANDAALATAGVGPLQQCSAIASAVQAYIRFREGFASAFKSQGPNAPIAGATYTTESGFPVALGGGVTAGAADSATEFRAAFNNIPAGTKVYVSSVNAGAVLANLISTNGEGGLTTPLADPVGGFTMYPVTLTNGSGEAIWEAAAAIGNDANALAINNLDFAITFTSTVNPAGNSPEVNKTGTVSGSFAPVPTDLAAGALASATLPIPRFVGSTTPMNLVSFVVCQTRLLFPYVVSAGDFDTGIAISNTSKASATATGQVGTCTLNFFGNGAPAAITTDPIGDGTTLGPVYAASLFNQNVTNFAGYMIATCNFQYAHGYAFISNLGGIRWAQSYLALVLPTTRTAPETLGQ